MCGRQKIFENVRPETTKKDSQRRLPLKCGTAIDLSARTVQSPFLMHVKYAATGMRDPWSTHVDQNVVFRLRVHTYMTGLQHIAVTTCSRGVRRSHAEAYIVMLPIYNDAKR